ncbi:glycoside hydrolase family 38 protein [Trichoderma velutinum]
MDSRMHSREGCCSQPAVKPVGKKIQSIHQKRLAHFTDTKQYKEQSIFPKLAHATVSGDDNVRLWVYSPTAPSRPTFREVKSQEFKPTKVGASFGPSWSTHWFRVEIVVPQFMTNYSHLEFHWNSNCEAMVWTEDGEPVQGLTGGSERGGERQEWIFPQQWKDGKRHNFFIEMACNTMFGNAEKHDIIQPPPTDKYFKLEKADIVAVNVDARQLLFDFHVIRDAALYLPQDSWQSHRAQRACDDILDTFSAGDGSSGAISKCREIARSYLSDRIDTEEVFKTDQTAIVSAIGHCHIDTCWLWPWDETKRKVARSWISQCNLMDLYPEYRFCCSQAQQYKWLETLYPTIYERVKGKVAKGTFQPIGGSWVEHDTNLPSGESLVRQFLYGQRYFHSRFGRRHTTFWLPDTFGYSGQLPQICRLAGMTRFFTQKLSWNNINNFPHTTFNWVALDSRSKVLCHMTPAEKYNAEATLQDLVRCETRHKSMDQDNTSLLVYGKGDGGGGPTIAHLESLRRCRGMSDQVGRLPRVQQGNTVDDFFSQLEHTEKDTNNPFVTWFGELYFEYHRGTYTTQAKTKLNNRRAEIFLHDLEYLATLASIQKGSTYRYPKKEIDEMWEKVLLCQFHDCLPGSSIEMCYDDTDKLYDEVFSVGNTALRNAATALQLNLQPTDSANLVGINTLDWDRVGLIPLPAAAHSEGNQKFGLYRCGPGISPLQSLSGVSFEAATISETSKGVWILSNIQYRVTVTQGTIVSLYDLRRDREIIPDGAKANQLVVFGDMPLYHQAWDVETYHLSQGRELEGGVSYLAENGPERVSVTTVTKISESSSIKTTISLNAVIDPQEESHIECSAEVDWHENMKFLKVQFPVDIYNTKASYETQFGIVERPTHYNTSWDMAKFEVCCHKWADLSEAGYGVSILNDSKYGFATSGNMVRLSLLRSPKAPDANADMGRHHIKWGILPHEGPVGWQTVKKGFEFNTPIRIASCPDGICSPELSASPVKLRDGLGLVLDTIKRAEDDTDVSFGNLPTREGKSIVCRVYDAIGGKNRAGLETGHAKIQKAWKCNLLEDDLEELPIKNGGVEIELQRFELATYRLLLD